jgi:MFS family permease
MSSQQKAPAITGPAAGHSDVRSRTKPARTNTAIFFGTAAVFAPLGATGTVLIPARLAAIVPDDKVGVLAVLTAVTAIVGFLTLFITGATSDRTRTRWGKRNPWILIGGAATSVTAVLLAFADDVPTLAAGYLLMAIAVNITLGALTPVIADRVPDNRKGIASSANAAGVLIGITLGILISSVLSTEPTTAFLVLAVIPIVFTALFLILAPDFDNRTDPRPATRMSLRSTLTFPRNAPDFYWAFFGRLAVILGYYSVGGYQLYLVTDYVGLDEAAAANLLGTAALVNLVGSLIGSVLGGPVSDRIGRRKPVTMAAAAIMGIGLLIPFFAPHPTAFLLYIGVAGIGLGAFLSVDAALMTQVLPSAHERGRDLGVLSLPTNGGQLIAPLIAAAIVGSGAGFAPLFIIAFVLCLVGAVLLAPIKSVK